MCVGVLWLYMSNSEYIWLAQREYESRVVFEDVFGDRQDAMDELASKQGGRSASDFNWEGLNYPEDDNLVVDDELELNERLIVKKKRVK